MLSTLVALWSPYGMICSHINMPDILVEHAVSYLTLGINNH